MGKQLLVLLLISLSNWLYSQDTITNIVTEKHENVAGTKVSMIRPDGFIIAPNFDGFQQNESASSIMVFEMPTSFSKIKDGFTEEALLSKGIELKDISPLIINGLSALLITGSQSSNGTLFSKIMLVLGDDEKVILINCAYPEDLQEIGAEITKSILTIIHEPELELDPYAGNDFIISTDSTDLVLSKYMANSYIFSLDGKFPTESESKTNFIITKSFSEVSIEDRKLFAINRMKQTPIDFEKIDSTLEISIDGISGYEVYAHGVSEKSGIEYDTYQVILFSDNLYYIFFGRTKTDKKKYLQI